MHNPQTDAVFLRCDETVPFGTFATVIDTLRQSGIENVSVVTEPLSTRPTHQLDAMSAVRIQIDDESLKGPLLWSVLFHAAAVWFAARFDDAFPPRRPVGRAGGGGGAVSVKLVGGLHGMPLPRPEAVTPSRVVDTTKGLYKSEPQPKPCPAPADAKQIPEFNKEKQPHYVTRPPKCWKTIRRRRRTPFLMAKAARRRCRIRSSQWAQAAAPTARAWASAASGGGDFGGRFPWYVDAVRNRVSSNWLQSTVDPVRALGAARRGYV